MSDDDEIVVPGLPRKPRKRVREPSNAPASPPGLFTVVATSAVTASLAAVAVVFALGRVQPAMLASSVTSLHGASSTTAAPVERAQSAASAEVTVPDLARIPAENVRAIVEAMGLRVIVNERREPSAIAAGLVAAQAPRAGSRLARGADVAVVISSGPAATAAAPAVGVTSAAAAVAPGADALVVVPSVHRLFARDARGRLSAAGLTVGAQRRGGYDEDMSPGRILRQSPSAGARVARGTAVDIWVNEE